MRAVVALFALSAAVWGLSDDARQIVQESQKRGQSASERYEGRLQVFEAGRSITEKRWPTATASPSSASPPLPKSRASRS